MKHVGSLFFSVMTLAIFSVASVSASADEGEKTPDSQVYTQVKPMPPANESEQERNAPALPGDKTLLNDLHLMIPIAPVKVSDYWIGVQCTEILPPLRSHLQLDEKQGMLVEWIMPDSPADKAGVEQYDVFLAVNGSPVTSVADISKVVDEVKDGEVVVSAVRKGQPIELKITPEKRPQSPAVLPDASQLPGMPRQRIFRSFQPGVIIEEFGDGTPQEIPENVRQMLEQIQQQLEGQMNDVPESSAFRFEQRLPGVGPRLNFGTLGAGMNTMQISIEPPRDEQEGTLTIRKNNQTWSVAKFSDLPKNVQKEVAEVLENTVNGKDVGDWIAEQIASNRRVTFSVTVSGNVPEAAPEETEPAVE